MSVDRRTFLSATAATGAGALSACASGRRDTPPKTSAPRKPIRMHLGTQRTADLSPERLQFFKRHGVDHIAGWPTDPKEDTLADDLSRAKDHCAKYGLSLDIAQVRLLNTQRAPRFMLGKQPEGDREIEYMQNAIRACAQAGIPAFKYNLRVLFSVRSGVTPGRGGSSYSTWKFEDVKDDPPEPEVGRMDADTFWERITYFLERVIPVCNEYKIRAMCHPHDPGVPPSGYKGVDRVLGTVEGLKKLVSIQESPYHGLNLCLGTTAEMLQDPANELPDVIRYLGERKKIFNIHFRNIVGKRGDFYEVYPDNGDMNMIKLALTLYEVDYPYMLMPDHMPKHPDDPDYLQGFAFGYGYIKAALQALETFV